MKTRQEVYRLIKLLVFLVMIGGSCIAYISEKNTWELGEYIFNNTIFIMGVIGVYLELYCKNVSKL